MGRAGIGARDAFIDEPSPLPAAPLSGLTWLAELVLDRLLGGRAGGA